MRTSVLLAAALAASAFGQPGPPPGAVAQVRAVYLLSMGAGLDQYLATQLTLNKVTLVVTDPAKADAVLTDRIGVPFEARLKELYPPEEIPVVKAQAKKDSKDAKDADAETAAVPKIKDEGVVRMGSSTWGRGRGNIFLVDVRTKNVIWSAYVPVKNSSPGEMERIAVKVAREMKKATGVK